MTALPPSLASDLARVRKALHGAPAGPELVEAREALERLAVSLRGAQALRAAVLVLGGRMRDHFKAWSAGGWAIDAEDDLLAAMCDAEERAQLP